MLHGTSAHQSTRAADQENHPIVDRVAPGPPPWNRRPVSATPTAQECVFCAIARHDAEASTVFEDDTVVAFMDRYPVTPGHLLVVPRHHAVGLEDLDDATGIRVWAVAHDLARTLRRSTFRPEGINFFLCDGEVAFQTVFHLHLHVLPRCTGDGWTVENLPGTLDRDRRHLDEDAREIRTAAARRAGEGPAGTRG
ncbi:diadenosine tetraphosphate (Ap4A) HIT family hydrolase [Kineococcus rhizosphaerae]|uniref:Diadenosine tetraphosphate (Ap4A) HIT family hydrolase n=1 Tax=Kineococcus rhizosphaerae TaxID=559628 RepID=A0A2T0QZU8_9ACTN|nr:diadenosine tetraphosphate (Ap4A) HIT family hydrolase [Kineococcus rhizosphaerae]